MRNIELKIRRAFEDAAPDVFDAVLARVDEMKGENTRMTEEKRNDVAVSESRDRTAAGRKWMKKAVAVAACLILLVGAGIGLNLYRQDREVRSTVELDVNPSIEILLNRKGRVVDVNARNGEAREMLAGMDFKGEELDPSLSAIVGSLLRNGYITDTRNSILVSVDDADAARGQDILQRITGEISTILDASSLQGSILGQTVCVDDRIRTLSDECGISYGKAKLILEIVDADARYDVEQLAPLSIHELNLLQSSRNLRIPDIQMEGEASQKEYIGAEQAAKIALDHAGLSEDEVSGLEVEMDYDRGRMVYEVEFEHGGREYEIDVDARTGAVVGSEEEGAGDDDGEGDSAPDSGYLPEGIIDAERAKSIALKHFGVSEEDVRGLRVELDRDNGAYVYEIEFSAGEYEYSVEIDAATGEVIDSEKEKDDADGGDSEAGTDTVPQDLISVSEAKAIALKRAGVAASDISNFRCELDRDGGVPVYEIEFDAGGYEYSVDVDAVTGAVREFEKELSD